MGCSSSKGPATFDFDLDFGTPEPQGETERKIYDVINESLEEAPGHLSLLTGYSGCEEPIRKALNDPGPKSEQAAWKAVSKAVDKLYEFYKFSLTLEKGWPMIMDAECGDDQPASIQGNLALAKQVAEIFSFVFHFDDAKMINPAIQNDFSYYRRVLSRMKHADKDKKSKVTVDEELANKMSFFFAYPTPMMKVVIDATTEFDKAARPRLIAGLSHLANLCLKAIEKKDFGEDDSVAMLFLCGMTGCIILVDHLHDEGAFHAKSPIRIKQAISVLKNHTEPTDFLLNSLRFTTLHLNDEQTMSAINKLLA
eukprot:TRINITY_DN34_c0_g1_i1.p1 TRINITY_DN34_c0_g1~~TRINITY_DN34_c0_g1_i1.p1  ORF type:complete len:332 (-),score=96.55 TRINITY_DN34_c0_g1_i1:55-984(-)